MCYTNVIECILNHFLQYYGSISTDELVNCITKENNTPEDGHLMGKILYAFEFLIKNSYLSVTNVKENDIDGIISVDVLGVTKEGLEYLEKIEKIKKSK